MRQQIQILIESIPTQDPIEQAQKKFIFEWIDSGAPLFRIEKPAIPPIHLVSYCVKIDFQKDKILLTEHRKSLLWLPPGGHLEPNEHPKDAALREIKEELSGAHSLLREEPVFVTVTETVGLTKGHTDVTLWYLFKGNETEVLSFDEAEFSSIKWFGFDEIPFEKADPNLKRFLAKLKTLLKVI